MSLHVSSAIQYNNNRGYSAQATKLIQSHTNSYTSGVFDAPTVTAIYNWQNLPSRKTKMDADGKVGPGSLGVMIAEMEKLGQSAGIAILRPFLGSQPSGSNGGETAEINPVVSYPQPTNISQMNLVANPSDSSRWIMKGSFGLKIKLNPQLKDPWRYEYKQYIRGRAFTQKGYWDPGSTIWTARSGEPQVSVNKYFQIPIDKNFTWGLTESWKEDGEVMHDGTCQFFGRRTNPPTSVPGLKDFYSVNNTPDQNGFDYELQDTYGLEGNYERGLRVYVELYYQGDIVKDKTQVVASKNWHYMKDYAINW